VADDYDFLLRVAAANFEFMYLPGVVMSARRYGGSMTGSRGAVLAEGRILALNKLLGRDAVTDRAVLTRVRELAVALHYLGYRPDATRNHLWFVMRRQPSRRVARALVENSLRLRPGALTGTAVRRAFQR